MLVKSQAKDIQSLGQKKQRDKLGLFIAEGPKIVTELLQTATVQQIYALKEWIDDNRNLLKHAEVTQVSTAELEKISQLTTPNNVLAVLKKFDENPSIETKGRLTLVLDTIQDPGNMGTIIRTADWFGVDQIVCSENCADIYNPKVVQSTMGSIARVKVLYTDLQQWLSLQKKVSIYAALLNGEDVTAMNKPMEGIIVIGNESKGISDEIVKLVNVKITIPQKGKAESLNAAVAAGIILSHITT
jgi:RNA methyltransferase, TrmH family